MGFGGRSCQGNHIPNIIAFAWRHGPQATLWQPSYQLSSFSVLHDNKPYGYKFIANVMVNMSQQPAWPWHQIKCQGTPPHVMIWRCHDSNPIWSSSDNRSWSMNLRGQVKSRNMSRISRVLVNESCRDGGNTWNNVRNQVSQHLSERQ